MIREFSASPMEMIGCLWRNRALIIASTKRDVLGRYRGSAMGLLWSFFNPLFMLAVYTFVFSEVFKSKWTSESNSKTEFALVLFAGLIVFNLFSECINRAPGVIIGNANYVKKVIFPLEILPFITLLSGLFHASISIFVWLIAYIFFFGLPHLSVLYMPLILLPLIMLIMGLSWCLASIGAYLRDVSQIIGIVTSVLMFLSPVFYPVDSIPENYRPLLYINPLTTVIEQTRAALFFGEGPDLVVTAILLAGTSLIAVAGFTLFQKTRKGFADVL